MKTCMFNVLDGLLMIVLAWSVLDIVPHKIAVVAIVVLVTILVVSWKWSMLGVILGFGALLLCWITAAIFFQISCAETDLCMKLILAQISGYSIVSSFATIIAIIIGASVE